MDYSCISYLAAIASAYKADCITVDNQGYFTGYTILCMFSCNREGGSDCFVGGFVAVI